MKILMLCEGMDIGGCETHVYELISALIEQNHEICLVCSGGRFAERLQRMGVRVVHLPTRRRDPLSLLYTAFSLRTLAREGFDLVHAHTRGMARLSRWAISLPLCVTVHLNFRTDRILRRLCHFGEATLAVSEDIADYLKSEYHIAPEQISLTHNGVDLPRFDAIRPKRGIVHLSRLDKDRSLCALLLCEAAPCLLSEHRDLKIHIFGDGNDFLRVKAAASKANGALGFDGVILHGATDDICGALAYGDIFVGVSRAAIEAMASHHATVIAGNEGYGGIVNEKILPSLLRSNFCARGLSAASARKLSIDLLYLLTHEEKRKECARFCRRLTEEYYTKEAMASDALLAYERAIFRYEGRAALIGYYGYGNFGDTMTLRALCNALPYDTIRIPCAKRECAALTPYAKKQIRYTGRYLGMLLAVMRSREVVFGGGTLFQNSTSTRSLFYYAFVAYFARLTGKRLRLIAGGIDQIQGRLARAIARGALGSFDTLCVRSERDRRNLGDLIQISSVSHLPDAVFLHTPMRARMLPYAVLILNAHYSHEGIGDLIHLLCKIRLTPLLVVLFPREDERLALRLCETYGIRVATKKDTEEIFSLIAHATLAISERMHGAIASMLVHRPCFLRTVSEKTKGLFEDVRATARAFGGESALREFGDYKELTEGTLLLAKKEAAGQSCGFERIIDYFRECWRERITPLVRESLQQRQQPSPWEPSSSMHEQRHQREP